MTNVTIKCTFDEDAIAQRVIDSYLLSSTEITSEENRSIYLDDLSEEEQRKVIKAIGESLIRIAEE